MIVHVEEWLRVRRRENRRFEWHVGKPFEIWFHLSTAQQYLPEYNIDEAVLADVAAEITDHGAFVGTFHPSEKQREAYIHFKEASQ